MKQSATMTILMVALCTPCESSGFHPSGDTLIDDEVAMLQVKIQHHSWNKVVANGTDYSPSENQMVANGTDYSPSEKKMVANGTGYSPLEKRMAANLLDGIFEMVNGDQLVTSVAAGTLTLITGWNVGGVYSLSDVTADSFKVDVNYGQGGGSYTAGAITFSNGIVATKVSTKYFISQAQSPHRFKLSTAPQCCGWTDWISFLAFDTEQPGSTKYFVSQAWNPHRFKVSTAPECCGWQDVFSFYAYSAEKPGSTKYFVSQAWNPHRFKVSTFPECCGWTDAMSFYAWSAEL